MDNNININAHQSQGSAFRRHLPDLSLPRFTSMQKQDAHEYADQFKTSGQPPWLHGLFLHWRELFKEPFRGITTDGNEPFPCQMHDQRQRLMLVR